jgi:hypothetical protein
LLRFGFGLSASLLLLLIGVGVHWLGLHVELLGNFLGLDLAVVDSLFPRSEFRVEPALRIVIVRVDGIGSGALSYSFRFFSVFVVFAHHTQYSASRTQYNN